MSIAITTADNPFNPIKEYESWKAFDFDHGYKTEELLARFCKNSIELSPSDYEREVESAIDNIINIFGNFFVKVVE